MQIRIYTLLGVLKEIISERDIISYDFQFGSQINSGQRDCSIEINRDFREINYVSGDIIEVVEYDDDNKSGYPLYTGYLYKKTKNVNGKVFTTILDIFGILSILDDYPYMNGGNYDFTLNLEPKTIIEDIISSFNSQAGFLGTDTVNLDSSIVFMSPTSQTYGSSINISFSDVTCKEALKSVTEKTNFYFFLKPTGELVFKAKPVTATHLIKQKTHTNSIIQEEIPEDIINFVRIKRASGQVKIYQDSTSISTYGKRYGKLVSKSDIQDEATLDTFGNNYILENKDLKLETKVELRNDYKNIIFPGETITLLYGDVEINNAQVQKVDYSKEKRVIYLDKYKDVGKLFI